MEDDLTLPLSLMRPAEIRELKGSGIILPIQPNDPTLAVTIWDNEPFAVLLDGPHAFTFFQIDVHSRFHGLFVATPEIVVSMPSATRGQAVWDKRGALILENGRANVVGSRAGDSWSEPVNVPLWQEVDVASAEGKTIGFTRWSLRVKDDHKQRVIWQSQDQPKAA